MVSNALMGQEEQCDFYYMTFGIVGSSRARVHSDTVFTASEEISRQRNGFLISRAHGECFVTC